MNVTTAQLRTIMPKADPKHVELYLPWLNAAMGEFQINTRQRRAGFLAQVAQESGQLSAVSENLNYSAARLRVVFGKYFTTDQEAARFAGQPSRIANRVYGGRGGNGPEDSGDGYRYRGAGLIQLTFKNNQQRAADYFKIPVEEVGDWLRTPEGAARSAGWFWMANGLNKFADKGDNITVSRRVNGGDHGLADRLAFAATGLRVLS